MEIHCFHISMVKKKTKYYIGCSGFYYPSWKNKFYPEGLSSGKWLEHYSTVFNTVELNGTFYRLPKLADLKKNYGKTPVDFKFSVKMNKYVTHILRLKNAEPQISEFYDLISEGLDDKLHNILFQMPPSFKYTEENLELLQKIPEGPHSVIEFRNQSWWNNKDVVKVLKKRKCTFCNVDFPGLETDFVNTSKHFYLRLHGSPELFKSSYSDRELENFYEKMPVCETYTIYFNNTYYEAGYKNALALKKIIGI